MKKVSQESANENTQERRDGMTQDEVAEALGMKRHQVDKLEKLALRKLKYIVLRKNKKEDFL